MTFQEAINRALGLAQTRALHSGSGMVVRMTVTLDNAYHPEIAVMSDGNVEFCCEEDSDCSYLTVEDLNSTGWHVKNSDGCGL